MKVCFMPTGALVTLSVATFSAAAHHSPVRYDLGATVTIAGEVAEYEWANPHVYLFVRDTGDGDAAGVWTVEAGAPTIMRRLGWSPGMLAPGDRVVVVGNPGRDLERKIAYLQSLEKAGLELRDLSALAPPADNAPASSFRADALSGNWAGTLSPSLPQFLGQAGTLPLTEKGAAELANFTNDDENPGVECVPFTAPLYMLINGVMNLDARDDRVSIRGEDAAVERVVDMTSRTHDAVAATVHGHSIGRWEGATLVVDTTSFADHRLGIAAGVPSGPRKHLVERFELRPDGSGLTYSFELSDPDYLNSPITGSAQWVYRPDLEFSPMECDPENARRFLAD